MKQMFSNFVTAAQGNAWYALTFVLLALLSLSLLAYESFFTLNQSTIDTLLQIDLTIAYIFLCDFLLGLFFNNKYTHREYWRHNWLDFISSIPISVDLARALRILRVFRAIRVVASTLDFYFARRRYKNIKK
jgi:Ion transport protein